jgi:hypothetical protein
MIRTAAGWEGQSVGPPGQRRGLLVNWEAGCWPEEGAKKITIAKIAKAAKEDPEFESVF